MAGDWYLDPRVTEVFPYVFGGLVLLILWFISIKFWRAIFGRKVKSVAVEAGIQFGDIEAMRKRGLISDEEYKVIRRTMAERAAQRMSEERRQADEARIFAEAQHDPEAARKLLADAPAPRRPAPQASAPQASAPPTPTAGAMAAAPTAAGPLPLARERRFADLVPPSPPEPDAAPPAPAWPEPGEWPQELGMMSVGGGESATPPARPAQTASTPTPSAAPTPAMNNPRVVRARNEARAAEGSPEAEKKQRDLDVLLAKGAISREEYERLRKFFE